MENNTLEKKSAMVSQRLENRSATAYNGLQLARCVVSARRCRLASKPQEDCYNYLYPNNYNRGRHLWPWLGAWSRPTSC